MSVLCNPADPKYIPDHIYIYMYIHILFYSVILYCIALHYIILYNYITLYMYIMTSSLIMCVHILDRIKSIVYYGFQERQESAPKRQDPPRHRSRGELRYQSRPRNMNVPMIRQCLPLPWPAPWPPPASPCPELVPKGTGPPAASLHRTRKRTL